jgi:hypothetical protein
MSVGEVRERGLFEALIADGRPPLTWTALALIFSGGFALFVSAAGQFLPHDIAFLGVSADVLRAVAGGRLIAFMFHDRVAFGGSLLAIGLLYLWLVEFPLRRRRAWAWWTLALSGAIGFGSFLTYLGYGYLDSWHGAGTFALLPLFALGLARSYRSLERPRGLLESLRRPEAPRWSSPAGLGRWLLVATGAGMVAGGGTIMTVGMTGVFVPQDLAFMGLAPSELEAIHPRLIPLIAHDRAGFGGGICSCGLLVLLCAWRARPERSLFQAFGLAGAAGFGTAIGVHFVIGYVDLVHLLPAYLGALIYLAALSLAVIGHRAARAPR